MTRTLLRFITLALLALCGTAARAQYYVADSSAAHTPSGLTASSGASG